MKSIKFGLAALVTGVDKETFMLKNVQKTYEELHLIDDISFRTKQNILSYMVKQGILEKFTKMRYRLNAYIKARLSASPEVIEQFIGDGPIEQRK